MREIATFSRSITRTAGTALGITVAATPLPTGVGALTPPDAGGEVVMTILAVPDESVVPANCDCNSNYKHKLYITDVLENGPNWHYLDMYQKWIRFVAFP